ncbi:MAG: reverse transcriptase domain-containing protein [Planctomycetota bacterium]
MIDTAITPATRFLADRLGLAGHELAQALAHAARGDYRVVQVPRGDGRTRELAEPAAQLKVVQSAILRHLLNHTAVSPFAHGFVPGRSIVTNARVHASLSATGADPGERGMVNADLKDAFPSVKGKRIRRVLEWFVGPMLRRETPSLTREVRSEVFDTLATLCTFRDCLPQGAPTSGMLLNLACTRLDRLIARHLLRGYASQHGPANMRYSRYADDLTFTASGPFSPEFVDALRAVVVQSGFMLNLRKTHRTSTRAGDLVICGVRLLPDGELGLPRAILRQYRALFDSSLAYDAKTIPDDLRHRIIGSLGFLRMVMPACPPRLETPMARMLAVHRDWLPMAAPRDAGFPMPAYALPGPTRAQPPAHDRDVMDFRPDKQDQRRLMEQVGTPWTPPTPRSRKPPASPDNFDLAKLIRDISKALADGTLSTDQDLQRRLVTALGCLVALIFLGLLLVLLNLS